MLGFAQPNQEIKWLGFSYFNLISCTRRLQPQLHKQNLTRAGYKTINFRLGNTGGLGMQ